MEKVPKSVPASVGLLALRVGAGALLLTHGWPKLLQVLEGNYQFMDPIGLGPEMSLVSSMIAEFVCALLVIAGLITRAASIPLIINFVVAALIFHSGDPWPKPEMAMLYGVVFVSLAFLGAGRFSVDHLLFHKGRIPREDVTSARR